MDDTSATPASTATATATASAAAVAADGALNKVDVGAATNSKTSVTLLIKSSNQQYDDMVIESDLLWSVRRLKTHLSLVYPSKPPVGEQKLIYSGQLLIDSLQLKDVIRSYKDVYTQNHIIHLVYIPKNLTSTLNKKPIGVKPPLLTANNMSEARSTEGLRQRHTMNAAGMGAAGIPNGPMGAAAAAMAANATPFMNGSPIGIDESQLIQIQSQQQNFLNYLSHGAPFGLNPSVITATAFVPQVPVIPPGHFGFMPPAAAANAFASQQMAMYNAWIRQMYTQYMDHIMRMSAAGQNIEQINNFRQYVCNAATAAANPLTDPATMSQFAPFHDNIANPIVADIATSAMPMPSVIPSDTIHSNEPIPEGPAVAAAATGTAFAQRNNLGAQQEQQPPIREQPPVVLEQQRRFPNLGQEDQENRDWLDSFLSITRLAIILTILYFNTSPLRCLIVILIGTSIYLYHIGVLRLRHERNNNNINHNNNAQPGVDQANIRQGVREVQAAAQRQQQQGQEQANYGPPNDVVDGAGIDTQHGNNEDTDNHPNPAVYENATIGSAPTSGVGQTNNEQGAPDDNNVDNEEDYVSVISIVRTFVVTFFTSLLPEIPAI